MASPHSRSRRRGASLVLFAMLVFALMAVAAVAIDVGMAGLTQSLMQDAADTAAIEGQRWRQYSEFDFLSDPKRRHEAAEMAGLVFDDDLDPSDGDLMNFGAGPQLDFLGGIGPSLGSQQLSVPQTPVYDPRLATNHAGAGDRAHGDMVSGAYDPDRPHVEHADYTREDFVAAAGPPAAWLGDAFLVRLRRTSVLNGLDQQTNTSTKGPGVPLLFGLGAAISGDGAYDPRRHGLTVRATTIARAVPALYVGTMPTQNGHPIPQDPDDILDFYDHLGATPFAVALDAWLQYTLDDPACVFLRPDGSLVRTADNAVIGRFVEPVHQVGNEVRPAPLPDIVPARLDGFIPVYADIDGVARVVGFGNGGLRDPLPNSQDCSTKTVSKFDTRLPVTGSCASFLDPADPLTPDEWSELFGLHRTHFTTDRLSASVLAPAIAR